ncbi:MAG: hypothetical protein WAM82_26015 [Thermoanaerobaculia bacterium]
MAASTARELYTQAVRALPLTERLRLAALILDDLAQSDVAIVEASDTWSEQDQLDVTAFSMQYAARLYPDEESTGEVATDRHRLGGGLRALEDHVSAAR